MRSLNRRGFTLVELVVVMMLLLVIVGAMYQSITAAQRTSGALVQRMGVQQSTRAAAHYMTHILRELDAGEGDIAVADPTGLEIRSMRWAGVLCSVPAVLPGNVITIRNDLLFGLRNPDAALDSILLFFEGDPADRADDAWLAGGVVATTPQNCDDGAGAGLALSIALDGGSCGLAGVTAGSPIRGFQQEEFSLYVDGTDRWLGQRAAGRLGIWTAVRPLIGPLTTDGLAFQYFTATGGVPTANTEIASIGLTVRGRSVDPLSRTGYLLDSIITRITLRNNPRF